MRIEAMARAVLRFLTIPLLLFVVGLGVAVFGGCEDSTDREALEQNFVRGCLGVEAIGRTEAFCRCEFEHMEGKYGLDVLIREEEKILETGERSTLFELMGQTAFKACIQHFDKGAVEQDWAEGCLGEGLTEAYCGCEFEYIEREYGLYSLLHELERTWLEGKPSTLFEGMLDSAYYACMQHLE